MGWISDWIFIWRTQGSGGLVTKYSIGVCRDLVDCWPNIHLVYAGIRWITDQIFGECRDTADYWLNIHLVYAGVWRISDWIFIQCIQGICRGPVDFRLNIQLVCAGIRRITDQIFIGCMHKQITNWIFIDCTRIEYLVVGMIGLGRLELNIQWLEWLD